MNDKLLKIQEQLKAPKNQRNDFGKYNYRSCEDIFEAVKPLLKENKITLRLTDELVQVGERYYIKATAILTDGVEIIENTAYAREEENKKGMDGSQITGASSTYARKYALNGLFLIDDVKDSDATNVGEITTKEEAEKLVITFGKYKGKTLKEIAETNENYMYYLLEKGEEIVKKAVQLLGYKEPTDEEFEEKVMLMQELSGIMQEKDIPREKLYKKFNVNSDAELTIEQLKKAIELLNK